MSGWNERAARRMNSNEAAPLISKATAPRPWLAMLEAWTVLLHALFDALGGRCVPEVETGGADTALHQRTWHWMWTLRPCSEARKAAWTLGAAALLIDRWREDRPVPSANRCQHGAEPWCKDCILELSNDGVGRRAEELLRRCRWHIDDAKIEASSPTRRPGIPPHLRVYAYSQAVDPEHGGVNFCGVMNDSDRRRVTLAILDDFVRHASERKTLPPSDDALIALAPALVDTLGASLPEGPWIVTSQDVWRFLAELLPEDAV